MEIQLDMYQTMTMAALGKASVTTANMLSEKSMVTSSTCYRCSCGICIRTLIMSEALVPFTAAIKV